jgi:uncharacterized membrane protein (DUF2068 family)
MSMDEPYSAAYLPPAEQHARLEDPPSAPGAGWLIYAGTLIAIAGAVNAIYGLAAISSSDAFDQRADYMAGSLETWGWVVLVIGVAQLCAGFGIWQGAQWARWLGLAAAGLNAVVQLMWLPSQPLAALALFALDLLVIYGLLRYGSRQMVEPS